MALFFGATSAMAQCAPDPTPAFGTVTCTGTDNDGIVVNTNQTTVNIDAGATVSTLLATTHVPANSFQSQNFITVNANGAITGGLTVENGTKDPLAFPFIFPSTQVNLVVGAAGSIGGPTAIRLRSDPAQTQGNAIISIDNSGTIQSASGAAILLGATDRGGVSNLVNRASGTIGGIEAPVSFLSNLGLIDGGAASALKQTFTAFGFVFPGDIRNSGAIRSSNGVATIVFDSNSYFPPQIINSGTIMNSGSGDAILTSNVGAPTLSQSLSNQAGATISAVNGVAFRGSGQLTLENSGTISGGAGAIVAAGLNLTNRGTVNGNMTVTDGGPFLYAGLVDNGGGGIINGAVTLGAGDDLVISDFGTVNNVLSGFNGTLDAGGGTNTLRLNFRSDVALSAPIATPQSFQRLDFGLGNDATVTLVDGFSTGAPISLGGEIFPAQKLGHLVNRTNLTTSGTAIRNASFGSTAFTVLNEGTITSTLQDPFAFAVHLDGLNAFDNVGTVTGIGGGGGGVRLSGSGTHSNSGLVVADGTALQVFSSTFVNSGTLRSNQGVGLVAFGSGNLFTNSGTIQGAVAGANVTNMRFVNSGTVSSQATGLIISSYADILNQATGTISGGSAAVGIDSQSFITNARLTNAGTINGDVSFGSLPFQFDTFNTFVAQSGGVLNGNLHLGGGNDLFVTSLVNSGPGQFAGVTGTVTGGPNSRLRYIVDQTSSAVLAPAGIFSSVGYDLSNNAVLTLTAAAPQSMSLELVGSGKVDLTADLSSNADRALIDMTGQSIQMTGTPPTPVPTILDVTSRGTLTKTHDQQFTFAAPAVSLSSGSSFRNVGTIIVNDLFPQQFGQPLVGISGSGTIINDGLISVGGGIGIGNNFTFGGQSVTNNGTIAQLAGALDGVGVSIESSLINNGTINTAGTAVRVGGSIFSGAPGLTNNGAIQSTNAIAVRSISDFQTVSVLNAAGGTITGAAGRLAVGLTGGSRLENAGTINGDVSLSYSESGFNFGAGSTYIARGGTINGNLTFGFGNDTLLVEGGSTGVTGIVDGGAGFDQLLQMVTRDTSAVIGGAALPTNFEAVGYDLANNAKLTLTAPGPVSANLKVAGVGSVDLTADLNGNGSQPLIDLTGTSVQMTGNPPQFYTTKLDAVSRGTLSVTRIDPFALAASAVLVGGESSFRNAGAIIVNDQAPNQFGQMLIGINGTGTIINEGTISVGGATGIFAQPFFGLPTVTNNGAITQLAGAADGVGVSGFANLVNNGTISVGGSAVSGGQFGGLGIVTNSGLLQSTNSAAISSYGFGQVVNRAGGTISGGSGQAAISITSGGFVTNAGTINGDVQLGSAFQFSGASTFTAQQGGVLNGNLTFGNGNDTLIVDGASSGVTGTIDAGAGTDTFVQGYTVSTVVDAAAGLAPASFELLGIKAIGRDVTVTVAGPAGGLAYAPSFYGDGTIINRADVNTRPNPDPYAGASPNFAPINRIELNFSGNFINEARVDDGVFGTTTGFSNAGTIGLASLGSSAVGLGAIAGTDFSFANSGLIQKSVTSNNFGGSVAVNLAMANPSPFFTDEVLKSATISNSGTIAGGLAASLTTPTLNFNNSGVIQPVTGMGLGDELGAVTLFVNGPVDAIGPTASVTNTGTIGGSLYLDTRADTLTFSNTNLISGGVSLSQYGDLSKPDHITATLSNTGTISAPQGRAALYFDGSSTTVDIINDGTLSTLARPIEVATDPSVAVEIGNVTRGNHVVSFANTGTITNADLGGSGLIISTIANGGNQATPAPANTSIQITSSGTIRANAGAIVDFDVFAGPEPTPRLSPLAAVGGFAAATDGDSYVSITNEVGGVIEATGNMRLGNLYPFFNPIPDHPIVQGVIPGLGSIAVAAYGETTQISNRGTITGGAGGTISPETILSLNIGISDVPETLFPDRYIAGAIQTFGGEDRVFNLIGGSITGSVDLGAGKDDFQNAGILNGDVYLRAGDDAFTQTLLEQALLSGVVDGGAGNDELGIYTGGGLGEAFNFTPFVNFETLYVTGAKREDTVGLSGALAFDTILLDQAGVTVAAGQTLSTAGPVTVTGSVYNESVTNNGTINGNLLMGGRDDVVSGSGTFNGLIDFGTGQDTLTLGAGGVITGPVRFGGGDTELTPGTDTLTNAGRIDGAVTFGNSVNAVVNTGTLASTLTFGNLFNNLTNSSTISGLVNMGAGSSHVINSGALSSGLVFGAANGTLNNSGTIEGQLDLGTGTVAATNSGTINAPVTLGVAGSSFANTATGIVTGLLTNSAGTVTNAGTLGVVTNAASFSNLAGGTTGAVTNTGTATNAGTLASLAQNAGTTTNSGTITGATNVAGGTLNTSGTLAGGLTNAATVNATGGALGGAIVNNAGGTINVAGAVTGDGTFLNADVTSLLNVNSGSLTLGGLLTNNGNIVVESGATLTDLAGIVNASGASITVKQGGTLIDALTNAGTVSNSGSYTADVSNSGAGASITNAATGVWTGNLTDNSAGATVLNQGRWDGTASNAATLTNAAGATWNGAVSNAAVFNNETGGTVTGLLTNSGGTASNAGTLAGGANVTGGTLANSGAITGPVSNAATFDNLAGGTLSGLFTNTAGTASNAGTLSGGANVTGGTLNNMSVITGAVTNGGAFANAAGATVSGLLTNSAGTTTNAGTLGGGANVTGGTLANSGTAGAVDVAVRGTFDNLAGGTAAAVTNAGTTTNAGTLASLTQSGGTLTNTGTVTGATQIAGGTLNTSGILSGGLTNAGTVNATGGAINGAIINSAGGAFNVAGNVTGNGSFSNAAPTSTLNLNLGGLTLAGALTNAGVVNFNGGSLAAASLTNEAGGVINGVVSLTSGADSIINQGRITGALGLGAGDDSITIQPGGVFGGAVDGGAGSDTLILAAGGNDAAPEMPGLGNFNGFERLRQTSGTVSLGGAFSIGVIDVTAGRLIGQAGSTITSGTITINAGATFGSAGTVAANIINNGTLAPGASPGVMNVTGNVNLGSGSTTLFEMTPTVSDQLIISGALTIASNATLTLTGVRPLTPGTSFDLIVAGGGISGSFATINKAASVQGFIAQRGDRIQLLGQFAVDAALNPQTAATVNYVNSVLTTGTPSAGLIAALPSLLTAAGGTNGAAFAQLNPEAYAAASQIGTENGLSIAKAMRAGSLTSRSEAGAFTFAQGLGDLRTLKGSTAQGVSKASINSYGVLGGIGFGSETASFAGFVGYLDAKQTIDGLSARNDADGLIVGATGRLSSGGFGASATLAYDASKAKTDRALPAAARATSNYKLRSFVADVTLDYGMAVGGDWEIAPQIGFTHVSTKRAAVTETGGTFALSVAGERYKADFVDASINVTGGNSAEAVFQPVLGVGLRHQLSGPAFRTATAGFASATQTFSVTGAGRAETLVTGKAGFGYKLGSNAALFGQYDGEFGGSGGGHSVNLGVRIGF